MFAERANTPPISYELYALIRSCVPKGSVMLELGNGPGSTVELMKDYDLWSVEHNPYYMTFNKPERYIKANCVEGWYDIETLNGLKEIPYKALLVDGTDHDMRILSFMKNLDCFNDKVHWFFDDFDLKIIKRGIELLPEMTGRRLIAFEKCGVKDFAVLLGKDL